MARSALRAPQNFVGIAYDQPHTGQSQAGRLRQRAASELARTRGR